MEYKSELEYLKKEIINRREQLGLSQYKASLMCGYPTHQSYMYLEENGNPHLKNLLRLSKGYKISFEIKNGELFIQ
jgi:transcriptional regulator with XRE-family HTH domain